MNKPTYSETCHACGGEAQPIRERVGVQIGVRTTSVMADRMKCVACGEAFYLPGQMQDVQRRAADKIRADEGLLAGDQVRSIRAGLGLSQPEFEHLLGVGPKTSIRWERGTVFQNSATDTLMRLLRDVPGVVEYLAAERGVALSFDGIFEVPGVATEYSMPPLTSGQVESPATNTAPPSEVIDLVEYKRLRKGADKCVPDVPVNEGPAKEVGG